MFRAAATVFFLFVWMVLDYTAIGFAAGMEQNHTQEFTHFSAELPDGWTGNEPEGFANPGDGKYMLVFTKRDEEGEDIKAAVTVFLLPPLRESTEEIAGKLASMQKNSSMPRQDGNFWTFDGEPQTQFKASACTRVAVTAGSVLIVIVQDPELLGGEKLFASLRGVTPEGREALGR